MHAHGLTTTPAASRSHLVLLDAREPSVPWSARALDAPVPPDGLGDARARRDELRRLLSHERAAAADFLLSLADFDRRRGWERLGHASLFAFLTRELGLSAGAAQLRLSAARLLPRHPAVEAALRDGRLCLSAVGQLARVLTVENEREVLPRFFGCSSREAMEVAAAILPAPAPPRREVVTAAGAARMVVRSEPAEDRSAAFSFAPTAARVGGAPAQDHRPTQQTPTATPALQPEASPGAARLHAHEVNVPGRAPPPTREVVPLTADLRRLHLTVTAGFLDRVAKARAGLSHALPGATTEQVLEAALEALLEQQARRKSLVRRPRVASPASEPITPSTPPTASGRAHVPAAVERAVRLRDGDRCQFPLDAGGVCGSTWRVELDHVVPVALGGETSVANLRCLCRKHNQAAAVEALGPAAGARRSRRARCGA